MKLTKSAHCFPNKTKAKENGNVTQSLNVSSSHYSQAKPFPVLSKVCTESLQSINLIQAFRCNLYYFEKEKNQSEMKTFVFKIIIQ